MRTNTALAYESPKTHGGATSDRISAYKELRRSVMTCMLFEDTFYESGNSIASRIADLCTRVDPVQIADLAIEARDKMKLRHVPLFLVRQLARRKGNGTLVAETLEHIIQRADELTEFCAIYWKDSKVVNGKRVNNPLSAGVKRGLSAAFHKFNGYQLAKYNRKDAVKLFDVMRLVRPTPKTGEAVLWNQLKTDTLPIPETWETMLSAGGNKKEVFEQLLSEKKLGGMALLRNLRNMVQAGVNESLIRERLETGVDRALPFRFITAAKYAPQLEGSVEKAMFVSLAGLDKLPGKTLLVVDISGSMGGMISAKSEVSRMDTACALAILSRELCDDATIYATAGSDMRRIHATEIVPARRGFALRDSIHKLYQKLGGGGIFLAQCMNYIYDQEHGKVFNRVIVLTDEQDCDLKLKPSDAKCLGQFNYIVNLAAYKNGVGTSSGWHKIDGWSERILDYIADYEAEEYRTFPDMN